MIYQDEDFLQLSGLQHFKFCRRQWALIHVEKQWAENYRTTDGAIMHENAHDGSFTESRGDLVITRDMRVFSRTLGVSGACDVLEFRRGETGIPLKGREGLWQPYPVEYKRGKPKEGTEDTLQLCGQAMCLEEIVSFSYAGASPALMGACAQREIGLAFCSPRGKFLARVAGQAQGNVLLRRMQYRVADDPSQSCRVAGMMIFGKVYNAKWSVERTRRDHAMRIDESRFSAVSDQLQGLLPQIAAETSLDSLRGLEGVGAAAYFSVLDDMILQGKETFFFRERSRRPPLDAFNALLSFAYSLLAHDCASALESVGLDAYVGYLHRDRPGRESLALDLMEELRPCFADRFVLTLINNRVLKVIDFDFRESGAVLLTDTGRRTFLQKWQERKKETITHPFLEEKIPWGLVPYVQSLLLARYLRGDLDDYPPFLWK